VFGVYISSVIPDGCLFCYSLNILMRLSAVSSCSGSPFLTYDEAKCVLFSCSIKKLNEQAAELFESGEDGDVNNGLIIMNEFIVPFLPLLLVDDMEEKDILAVEDMRNRWCSYLGQEMEGKFEQCR
jgi:hypothetical protein